MEISMSNKIRKESVGGGKFTFDVWSLTLRKWIGPFFSKQQAESFDRSVNG